MYRNDTFGPPSLPLLVGAMQSMVDGKEMKRLHVFIFRHLKRNVKLIELKEYLNLI